MSECIINLESLGTETRSQPVFYASQDFIVYKESRYLILANCAGEIISKTQCPSSARSYEFLDLDEMLLFVFGGKDVVVFDKFGELPISYRLDVDRWGKIITKLYPSHYKYAVVFGTKFKDKVQFINYNFLRNKRISQSSSWTVNGIDDVMIHDEILYAILDSSFLVACKVETCESLWTRFEHSLIQPKIIPYKKQLLYACQGSFRSGDGKASTLTKIPLVRISQLIGEKEDHLFLLSDDDKNVCAYNLSAEKVIWEITGQSPILETMLLKGKADYDIDDVLLARSKDTLNIVNLTRGRSSHHFKLPGAYRMRQTADHILIHKYNQTTDMIPNHENKI